MKRKLNVALISPWKVYPITGGGLILISKIIEVLAQEGISCYLLQPSERTLCKPTSHVDGGGVVINYELAPRFLTFLLNPLKLISTSLFDAFLFTFNYDLISQVLTLIKTKNIDHIICYCSLQLLPAYFLAKITKRPLTLILGDVLFITYYRRRKILKTKTPPYPIIFFTFLLEKLSSKFADKIAVLSRHDKEFLCQHGVESGKLEVIRQSIDLDDFDAKLAISNDDPKIVDLLKTQKNKHIVIFHGSLIYLPNRQGCEYIVNELEPNMRKKRKDVIFVIAGPNPPKELISKNNNVIFTGFVENLPKIIKLADVAIVPIISGGGVRNKLLDYFACSKPVISTKIGAEGLEVNNMEHLILADDLQDFTEKIGLILDNPNLALKLGRNARKYLESKHTLKNFKKYAEIVRKQASVEV